MFAKVKHASLLHQSKKFYKIGPWEDDELELDPTFQKLFFWYFLIPGKDPYFLRP
jgi:hypothetical protein